MQLLVTDNAASLDAARRMAGEAESEAIAGMFGAIEEAARRPARDRWWPRLRLDSHEKGVLLRNRESILPRLVALGEGRAGEDDRTRVLAAAVLDQFEAGLGDRFLLAMLDRDEPGLLAGALGLLWEAACCAGCGERRPLELPEGEQGFGRVLGLLDHEDPEVAVEAARLLGDLRTDAATEVLLARLDDPRLRREAWLGVADDGRCAAALGRAFETLARSGCAEDARLGLDVVERFARADRDPVVSARAARMLAAIRDDPQTADEVRKRIDSTLSWIAYRDSVEAARPADTARAEARVGQVLGAGLIGPADADAANAALRESEDGNWSRDDAWGARVAFEGCWVHYDPESDEDPPPCDEMVRTFAAASRGAFAPEAVYQLRDGFCEDRHYPVQFIHRGRLYQFLVEGSGTGAVYAIAEAVNAALAAAGEARRFVRLTIGRHWAEPLFGDPARLAGFVGVVGWGFDGVPEPESVKVTDAMVDPARFRLRARLRDLFHPSPDVYLMSDAEFPRATDRQGQTALHRAAFYARLDLIAALLADGADPNARDGVGRSPLYEVRRVEAIGPLVAGGADLEARDIHGWTPLHAAASFDRADLARALIELGADLRARDRRGFTPLHAAANDGAAAAAGLLLDRGAPVDERSTKVADLTPVEEGERTLEMRPFDYQAYFRWHQGGKVEDGQTPLHRAAYWGHAELTALLLEHGADVHAADALGQTPLDLAETRGHGEVAGLIRRRGRGRDDRGRAER